MSSAQCLLKTRQIIFASDAPFVMLLAAAAHSFCACSTLFCYKSGPFVLFLSPSFPQIHFFPILIYWNPFFKSFWHFLVCFFLPSECVKNSVTLFFFSRGCETASGFFSRISKRSPAGNVLPRWTEFQWRNIRFCDIPIWTMDFVFIGQFWVNGSVIAEIKGPYHHKNFTISQPQERSIFQGGNQSLYTFWSVSVLLEKYFLFPVQQTASRPPLVWCGCQMQWLLLTYFVLCFHLILLPILKEKKWHLFSPLRILFCGERQSENRKKFVCVIVEGALNPLK